MRRPVPFLLLLLAACSKGTEQPAAPAPSQVASSMPGEDAASATPEIPTGPASRYTSFKDCELVKSGAGQGEDWSLSRCKGLGGYDLQIDYGDARDELVLRRAGRPSANIGLFALDSGHFNSLAETAEWRGLAGPQGFAPKRLIVRNNVSEDSAQPHRQTSILVVIDLDLACAIAQVRPGKDQNLAARAIADGPPRACLKTRQ